MFDEGRYFEAHEAWEEHWLVEKDESRRRCLQGLIQIAAGFHKLFSKNAPESAARLLAKGLDKLHVCPPELRDFREAVRACAGDIAMHGRCDPARVPKLARS